MGLNKEEINYLRSLIGTKKDSQEESEESNNSIIIIDGIEWEIYHV